MPIRYQWAKELFDHEIADEELFGSEPRLSFNITNVYYTSANISFQTPARILWYISNTGKSRYRGHIRACSYLDVAQMGSAKELFKQYKRLGVYDWKDVFSLAKNSHDKQITAIQFSHTELLKEPIDYENAKKVLKQFGIASNNFVGPQKVTEEVFFQFYNK